MRFFFRAFLLILYCHSAAANIATQFNQIKQDPNLLYAFLREMPKGGELHYHLAGGAFPETMLDLAAKGNYCLDLKNMSIGKVDSSCQGFKSNLLKKHSLIYQKFIRAWSMQDFKPQLESSHDHFFSSFYKFMPLVVEQRPQLLAEIMRRAANQHEHYLEIMILPDNGLSANFAPAKIHPSNLAKSRQRLLRNSAFQKNIKHTISEAKSILEHARRQLNCNEASSQEVCQLTVKFQYYILREQPLEKVFAQALNGFAAATNSKEIVGINLVQREDAFVSRRDYQQQMQIFNFLHQMYPKVHVALHAGELTSKLVPANDLRSHIFHAIHTGKAERIGHGIDIASEDDSKTLLQFMAKQKIAVEINLTSNQTILDVHPANHPLSLYLAHHVPVVLSTDDEGILRTDLTQQYVEAVLHQKLDYSMLKTINRNTLTYSFLPGKSLWEDASKAIPISACQSFTSHNCLAFIEKNDKARLQWQLETKLAAFEKLHGA